MVHIFAKLFPTISASISNAEPSAGPPFLGWAWAGRTAMDSHACCPWLAVSGGFKREVAVVTRA